MSAAPVSSPKARPKSISSDSDEVLLAVYYFGDCIGSCEDYSTITTIVSGRDKEITIRDVKNTVAHFLQKSKLDRISLSQGPVTIDSSTISPLHEEEALGQAAPSSSSSVLLKAAVYDSLLTGMIAVIVSEDHVSEILSNIERMNIVVGREPGALNSLDNWCMKDSKKIMTDEFLTPCNLPSSPILCKASSKVSKRIDIILAPGNKMPVPPPSVTIVSTSKVSDLNQKLYTVYHMIVKQAGLEWTIAHRYSDFTELYTNLLEQEATDVGHIMKSRLPELPPKEIVPSSSIDDAVVKKRSVSLQTFVRELLLIPSALSNIHVLSFFGILSTSRHNHIEKLGARNTIHLSKLKTDCRWGDLILFKCANRMSQLQRSVTGAEWDHVGIVVRGNNMSTNSLELLEATGEGVTSYPLFSRIRAYYDTKFAEYMCLRRLDVGRDIDLFQKLHRFASRVVGKPYGFTFSKLIASRTLLHNSPTTIPSIVRSRSANDVSKTISTEKQALLADNKSNVKVIPSATAHEEFEDPCFRMSSSTNRSSYVDIPKAATERRRSLTPPPKKKKTKKEKLKAFLNGSILSSKKTRSDGEQSPSDSEEDSLKSKSKAVRKSIDKKHDSFFCSELVAACLQAMDLLPSTMNVSAVWPGCFARGEVIDQMMVAGAGYGEEYIMDCRVLEVSRAKMRDSWSSAHAMLDDI